MTRTIRTGWCRGGSATPPNAGPNDESVYAAADPLPDDSRDEPTSEQPETSGSTTEAAAAELAEENESEPSRSE